MPFMEPESSLKFFCAFLVLASTSMMTLFAIVHLCLDKKRMHLEQRVGWLSQ